MALRELCLFAGAGGILGGQLLGWRTVCAVEFASYPRRVLLARIADGTIGPFPVHDDVRTFDGRRWVGSVDVVSGGYPCLPFSRAAHGNNTAPNLWPEMFRIIAECRPRHVFAENVTEAAIEHAQRDLEALGFVTARAEVSAAAVGGPHIRERWWLRGDSDPDGEPMVRKHAEVARVPAAGGTVWPRPEGRGIHMADGVAREMDQLGALGNGQIPIVAARAWQMLGERIARDRLNYDRKD